MTCTFPDLLDALAEAFLVPGAPGPAVAGCAGAAWAEGALGAALAALDAAPREDLAVAHAGLFHLGTEMSPVYLERSVLHSGRLLDPEILDALDPLYEAAGLSPAEGIHPDHLGALLALDATLLRQDRPDLAWTLHHDHLEPLGAAVAGALARPGTPPAYAALGRALAEALTLNGQLCSPSPTPSVTP